MVAVRNFIDNSPTTNFPAGLNSSDATAVVSSLVGFPVSFPYYATIDLGQSTAEVISVTGAVGLTISMLRNANGQGAFAHLSTGTLNHTAVALDYTEANAHHVATTAHGTTSAVVGINDTQTLNNKTLNNAIATGVSSSPAITANVSGTSDALKVIRSAATVAKIDTNGVVTGAGLVSTANITNTGTITSTGTISTSGGGISALGTISTLGGGLSCTAGTVTAASASIAGATATATFAATGAATAASFTANANGVVSGVIVPKSYTNQAAALAGAAGQMVYLTAPTGTGSQAGFWTWNAAASMYEPISGHYAQLRSTATTSLANGAFTAIAWDTTDYDPCSMVTSSQVLAKAGIQYRVSGTVNIASNATGRRLAAVYVNGVIVPGSQVSMPAFAITGGQSVTIPPVIVTAAATNVIEIKAFQDSGGALNTVAGCLLHVARV